MQTNSPADNRPDAAHHIANHTKHICDAMNGARHSREVKTLFDDWMTFARKNRVCEQIVEHMVAKRRVLIGEFDRSTHPASSDLTKRMTGDHE